MKRVLILAVLLLSLVGMTYGQATIPKNVFSWGVAKNLVSGGSTYFTVVACTSSTGAQTLEKGTFFVMTGTNTITSIVTAAAEAGRIVVIQTTAGCTLSDGGNLKLASSFSAGADDVIMLVSDGTDWFEVCRSAN
jgi:arginine repressor